MSPQSKSNWDWVVKGFIALTMSTVVGLLISMRADLTTIMVRTEGIDRAVMQHEKRLDAGESVLKDMAIRVYSLKNCCE